MFDIGWQEIFIIAIFALIVVGPKDLPRVLRTATQALRKVKGMAREFQSGIDDVVREAELEDLKKDLEEQGTAFKDKVTDGVNPIEELTGEFEEELDFSKEQLDLDLAAKNQSDTPIAEAPAIADGPVETAESADAKPKKTDG